MFEDYTFDIIIRRMYAITQGRSSDGQCFSKEGALGGEALGGFCGF